MRKVLVALTRAELDWLVQHLEERCRWTVGGIDDTCAHHVAGVIRAAQDAQRVADGEGPLYPLPKGKK